MTIGPLELDIFIPQANSLKSKRRILKGLKERVRQKFNVSVAEINCLDKWQRQVLAVACVNNDSKRISTILSKIVNLVDTHGDVELIDYSIEHY